MYTHDMGKAYAGSALSTQQYSLRESHNLPCVVVMMVLPVPAPFWRFISTARTRHTHSHRVSSAHAGVVMPQQRQA